MHFSLGMEYVESAKGKRLAVVDNYLYKQNKHNDKNGKTYWNFREDFCGAIMHSIADIPTIKRPHVHPPNAAAVHELRFRAACKSHADTILKPKQIYQEQIQSATQEATACCPTQEAVAQIV